MSVFLELALQMCEESQEISSTGEVSFIDLVAFFSAAQTENEKSLNAFSNRREKVVNRDSELCQKFQVILAKAHKLEGYAKTAASSGHVGVLRSLCEIPEMELVAKRKMEIEGDELKFQSKEDFSALGVAIVENQTQAAKVLLEAGFDQYQGFQNFGTAMHQAVMQGNPEIVELLPKQDESILIRFS